MSTIKAKTQVPKLRFPGFEGGWSSATTGSLCDIIVDCVNKTAPIVEEKTPYKMLRTTNVRNGRIDLTYCRRVTQDTFKIWTRRAKVERGDVILTREAPIGEVGYVDFDDTVFLGQRLMQYRVNTSKLNPKYLLYSFLSPSIRDQFAAHDGTGSTVSHIRVGDCSRFIVTHPSLPEQRKIADFLTAVDGRLAQLSQKKALLEAYKKGVMQQLFTQALRFKDDHGNGFPEWEKKTLGDIARLYQPKTISQSDLTPEGFTVYGANGIIGKYHSYNHEKEQVTVTCRGSTCGVVNFTESYAWITGNAMVVNMDNKPDSTKSFVYHTLCASDLRYLITGSGQPQITSNLKEHKIGFPSLPEQTKIANFLTALDRKIEAVAAQIAHTQTWKKGLLQQMFV